VTPISSSDNQRRGRRVAAALPRPHTRLDLDRGNSADASMSEKKLVAYVSR